MLFVSDTKPELHDTAEWTVRSDTPEVQWSEWSVLNTVTLFIICASHSSLFPLKSEVRAERGGSQIRGGRGRETGSKKQIIPSFIWSGMKILWILSPPSPAGLQQEPSQCSTGGEGIERWELKSCRGIWSRQLSKLSPFLLTLHYLPAPLEIGWALAKKVSVSYFTFLQTRLQKQQQFYNL